MGDYYDVAQICRNGHVINSMAHSSPETNQDFCERCGESTIMKCQQCGAAIRGYYHMEGVFGGFGYSAPAYCYACGHPFPWSETKLAVAKELADLADALSSEERQALQGSLDDLVRDTPRTALAAERFKMIMRKVSRESYEAIKSVLVDIVSETVRKSVFGP